MVVWKEAAIFCSETRETSEQQKEDPMIRVAELQKHLNAQPKQVCEAKVRAWLGKPQIQKQEMDTSAGHFNRSLKFSGVCTNSAPFSSKS